MSKTPPSFDRYLPPSDRARQWGLYVTGAGYGSVAPGGPYPRRGHPASHDFAWQQGRVLEEYQWVFISAGSGQFESIATGPCPIAAGTVLLLFPGVWHRYRPAPATGWVESWVGFSGEDAARWQHRGFLRPEEPLLDARSGERLAVAFSTLIERLRDEPPGFEQLLASSVAELLALSNSAALSGRADRKSLDMIRRAKQMLEKIGDDPPRIDEIAAALRLSVSRFQHLFREHTGFSPYQYHLQVKLQQARELLRGTDLPIERIARELHFKSVYHFSAIFKRKAGASPLRWRESSRGRE